MAEKKAKFPVQLMSLLNDNEHQDIVAWLPHGAGFTIFDKKQFQEVVMPNYFDKGSKYTSFTRRLNRWNFTIQTNGKRQVAYFHPLFNQNFPERCLQMHPMSKNSIKDYREMKMIAAAACPMDSPGSRQMPMLGAASNGAPVGSLGNGHGMSLSQPMYQMGMPNQEGNTPKESSSQATSNISPRDTTTSESESGLPVYHNTSNAMSQEQQAQSGPVFAANAPMVMHQGYQQGMNGYQQGMHGYQQGMHGFQQGVMMPSAYSMPHHMLAQQFMMAPRQMNYYPQQTMAMHSMMAPNTMGQYQMSQMENTMNSSQLENTMNSSQLENTMNSSQLASVANGTNLIPGAPSLKQSEDGDGSGSGSGNGNGVGENNEDDSVPQKDDGPPNEEASRPNLSVHV